MSDFKSLNIRFEYMFNTKPVIDIGNSKNDELPPIVDNKMNKPKTTKTVTKPNIYNIL